MHLSGYRHTQTQTAEAVTEACRHHSGHSTSISGLFLLYFQGRAGTQILTKTGPEGGEQPSGWAKTPTSPPLAWGPAQGPHPYVTGAPCAPGLWAGSGAAPARGRVPQEQAGQQLHIHTSTSTSACSGLQPPDLQRQAPGGSYHQVALSTDLGRDMRTQGRSGQPAGHRGQSLTPFSTLWWLRVQMVLGGSVGTCTWRGGNRQSQEVCSWPGGDRACPRASPEWSCQWTWCTRPPASV